MPRSRSVMLSSFSLVGHATAKSARAMIAPPLQKMSTAEIVNSRLGSLVQLAELKFNGPGRVQERRCRAGRTLRKLIARPQNMTGCLR